AKSLRCGCRRSVHTCVEVREAVRTSFHCTHLPAPSEAMFGAAASIIGNWRDMNAERPGLLRNVLPQLFVGQAIELTGCAMLMLVHVAPPIRATVFEGTSKNSTGTLPANQIQMFPDDCDAGERRGADGLLRSRQASGGDQCQR